MNVADMVANDIKRCVRILRTCLQMHICIPLKSHPPEVANDIKRCVWILRTCMQMHSCIPLKSHPPEQI